MCTFRSSYPFFHCFLCTLYLLYCHFCVLFSFLSSSLLSCSIFCLTSISLLDTASSQETGWHKLYEQVIRRDFMCPKACPFSSVAPIQTLPLPSKLCPLNPWSLWLQPPSFFLGAHHLQWLSKGWSSTFSWCTSTLQLWHIQMWPEWHISCQT